jgi:hypothetical protein
VLERTEELPQGFDPTTLAQQRAEIELTRLALARESSVLRGWLEQWADNIEEMRAMDFEGFGSLKWGLRQRSRRRARERTEYKSCSTCPSTRAS